MKDYDSLFTQSRTQPRETAFAAFFPPTGQPFDTPFKWLAEKTLDGEMAWGFEQEVYRNKYSNTNYPKLKNYLNYTFIRLLVLENEDGGGYFITSPDGESICFNSGLQDKYSNDLILTFSKYIPNNMTESHCDWVYRGANTPNAQNFIDKFGTTCPKLAWYTTDSRDYIFDLSYSLNDELFEHVFVRAKERAGMPNATDEIIKSYLCGVLRGLIPKIQRNYKVAIPMYYVQEKKMQLLLPFPAVTGDTYSAFLVERDDERHRYILKTILDMDHAYFAARLITRPDEYWLKP